MSEGKEQDGGHDGERTSPENSRVSDPDSAQPSWEGNGGDALRKRLQGGGLTGELVRRVMGKVLTEVLQLYKEYGKDSCGLHKV